MVGSLLHIVFKVWIWCSNFDFFFFFIFHHIKMLKRHQEMPTWCRKILTCPSSRRQWDQNNRKLKINVSKLKFDELLNYNPK